MKHEHDSLHHMGNRDDQDEPLYANLAHHPHSWRTQAPAGNHGNETSRVPALWRALARASVRAECAVRLLLCYCVDRGYGG